MHSYKAAAVLPAKGKREENLEKIGLTLDDFGNGQKAPHYYINKEGNKSIMVPIFNS